MTMSTNFIDKLNDFKNDHRAYSYLSDSSESTDDRHELVELDNLLEDLFNAKQSLSESNTSTSSGSSPAFCSPNSVVFRRQSSQSRITDAEKELQSLIASLSKYKSDVRLDTEKNVCFKCKKSISGRVITALGYLWHPEHFVCTHCDQSIGTSIFYEKDSKPYCEQDYFELFSPKCAACSQSIKDKMLTALSKTWHIECFVCFSCKKLLNDESFLEIDDSAFCKECYVCKMAPKCKRCSKAIIENFISALNGYWHPNCFVCQECAVPFNSSCFFEYAELPYCEFHYHQKRGSLCSACQSPINGRCITALNKKFHPEHFTCSYCLKQLSKGTFKENNERPFCQQCFKKLFY